MKKFTFAVLTILVSFCFILSGCSKAPLTMPEDCTVVYSNGGFVVGVDNYLYFGNAYKAYSDLKEKSDNEGSGVKDKALNLNRVELNNVDLKSLKLDEDEFLTIEIIPIKELLILIRDGIITDGKTQVAILKTAINEGLL